MDAPLPFRRRINHDRGGTHDAGALIAIIIRPDQAGRQPQPTAQILRNPVKDRLARLFPAQLY
jgi:hypothetical protein